jgi:hypothetical protein
VNIILVVISVAWALLLSSGQAARADDRTPWEAPLEAMDRALITRDVSAAEITWRQAYRVAMRDAGWRGLVAVGDAALRISDEASYKPPYQTRARRVYRWALFRARQNGSVDGVLRVAEAFATLGDADVVTQALDIADRLASADATGEAQRRVLTLRALIVPGARPTTQADPLLLLFPDAAVGP